MFKKLILITSFIIWWIWSSFAAPSFDNIWWQNVWYNVTVSRGTSLEWNIRNLFFPDAWRRWWIIWEKLRVIAVWLLFIFLVWAGALFVLNADDDGELKKAKMNIVYILYWAFLVFASVFLLWYILNVWWDATTAEEVVIWTQRDIIWTILIFLKSAAYYIAILMMVYYWYKIVQAQEKEDKIKAGRTGALNIIIALVAIKVLDYVYFIAQKSNLKAEAWNFLVWAWKILGWVLWVIIIVAILYAAILLITSRWNEEAWKKSKTIIRNVFIVIFVLFLFIVIVYDLIKNFAA